MPADWRDLKAELAQWQAEQLPLPIWWRDDDAIAPSAALDRLLSMGNRLGLGVHLAIIPKHATPALADRCATDTTAVPLVHGWAHQNTATKDMKKSEFGRLTAQTDPHLREALNRMQTLFGPRLANIFVPPWNRIAPQVTALLPAAGYHALSTYTPRATRCPVPGLVQINTHIDPIHWKAGGGLLSADAQIARLIQTLQDRRQGRSDTREPLGLLTHHLVHDAAIWDFTDRLLQTLLDGGATPIILQKEPLP